MRGALEAALDVARAGITAAPPVAPPPRLRTYLGFTTKLAPRALAVIRKVVDEDDDFRARVVAATSESKVGRAGWLFLARPDGWEDELAALDADARSATSAAAEARADRGAARKLGAARDAQKKAESASEAAIRDAATARSELTAERRRRSAAERRVTALEGELAGLTEDRTAVLQRLKVAEQRLSERTAELKDVRSQLRQAGSLDGNAVREAIADVTGMARVLADALGALANAANAGTVRPAEKRQKQRRVPSLSARRPAPLPGGVLEDSAEAATHLLRIAGVIVFVDGYNVSKERWPDKSAEDQRSALVSGLQQLAARSGARIEVVFDGAEVDRMPSSGRARDHVRVRFTRPDVEADDEILTLIEEIDLDRVVVVTSSDKRVREGARARGANVLHSSQLLAAMRR